MFRRLRWIILGAAIGIGIYLWARGKAQDARSSIPSIPEGGQELAKAAREGASDLGSRLRDALREGIEAMREREDELRREMLGGGSAQDEHEARG